MGFCCRRNVMLTVCFIQLLTIIERQVFDFLGFLWIPILVNFTEIIFVIFGFFGALQYQLTYVVMYCVNGLAWLCWNVFIICLYLDVGVLNHKENKVIKLDPGSGSWWINGPGCKATLNTTATSVVWENVTDCWVDYRYVEVIQSGLQSFLVGVGIACGLSLLKDCKVNNENGNKIPSSTLKRRSLYSIEYTSRPERQSRNEEEFDNDCLTSVSPKPMTPRRVKRRNVMTRSSSHRQSKGSRRHSTGRNSTRNSRRSIQNPVTKLFEQQRKIQPFDTTCSSLSIDPLSPYYKNPADSQNWQSNGHTNPIYQQSSVQSLNESEVFDDLYNTRPPSVRSSYSNFHGTRVLNQHPGQNYSSHATPQVPQKRQTLNRQSLRSMVFLSNGPPAYTSPNVDSETTM